MNVKNLKILLLLLTFSFCSQSSEMTMGAPEPYFGGVEDMVMIYKYTETNVQFI